MTDDTPSLTEVIESDDPELADRYNEAQEAAIKERLDHLDEQKQEAVSALRESAQESLETETVTLDSGVTLEVRTRLPPNVEQLQAEAQQAEEDRDYQRARRLTCEILAAMVESPAEFGDPDVWATASRDGSAGLQWLLEATDIVLEPAIDSAEAMGNEPDSANTRGQTKDRQSGWQRQR